LTLPKNPVWPVVEEHARSCVRPVRLWDAGESARSCMARDLGSAQLGLFTHWEARSRAQPAAFLSRSCLSHFAARVRAHQALQGLGNTTLPWPCNAWQPLAGHHCLDTTLAVTGTGSLQPCFQAQACHWRATGEVIKVLHAALRVLVFQEEQTSLCLPKPAWAGVLSHAFTE